MNKKRLVPIMILTILLPFIATPTRQAQASDGFPNFPPTPSDLSIPFDMSDLLTVAGFSPCIFPALTEVWYQLIHSWADTHVLGDEGTFQEWQTAPHSCGFPSNDVGPFTVSASALSGSGGGTVIPGTWGTPVNLAVNTPPPIALPEFNPSIAADPTSPNNVVVGQFSINAGAPAATAIQCSLKVSNNAGVSYGAPFFLPLAGSGAFSFCSRAMVAWDSAGTVYVLYTDYETGFPAAGTHSFFRMVKSVDKGATWTDLSGAAGVSTIHDVPLVVGGGGSGTEAGIPMFPVLAVSGSNLDVAYTLFSNLPTDDIRSISSADAGATAFTNPVVIATVNPSTGHLILAPSSAYNRGTLYVVWYDDDTIPPPSAFYEIRASKSTDNGVTWTTPSLVSTGVENAGPFHRGVLTWPSEWPHLAIESNSNFAYVVTTAAVSVLAPVVNAWNQYHLVVVYSTTGDISSGTGRFTQVDFPNPDIFAPYDQLFPAVTTQPDGTVHVTWLDTAPGGAAANSLTAGGSARSEILYSASNPSKLQPEIVGPHENWAIPQLASFTNFGLAFFSGIFFSVTASSSTATVNGFVHTAWVWANAGTLVSLDTFTNRGTKPLLPVGGAVLPNNELALLAPYLAVAVFATLGLAYAMRRRFRNISLPTIPTVNW